MFWGRKKDLATLLGTRKVASKHWSPALVWEHFASRSSLWKQVLAAIHFWQTNGSWQIFFNISYMDKIISYINKEGQNPKICRSPRLRLWGHHLSLGEAYEKQIGAPRCVVDNDPPACWPLIICQLAGIQEKGLELNKCITNQLSWQQSLR